MIEGGLIFGWFGFWFLLFWFFFHSRMSTTGQVYPKHFPLRYKCFLENLHSADVMLKKLWMTENEGFYWKLFDSFSYSCHEHPSYDIWSSTVTRAGTADAVIIAYKHLYPTSHKIPIMEHYPVSSARHTSLKPQHKMKKSQCKQKKKIKKINPQTSLYLFSHHPV